jgi:hypothetical protein
MPPRVIESSVDILRTAPVGIAQTLTGLAAPATELALNGSIFEKILDIPVDTFGLVWTGLGIAKIYAQFKLKHRLEGRIEAHEFRQFDFRPTTTVWCHRQTARLVCEKAGYLEEYEKLCEANHTSMENKWLPHF